MVKKLPAMQVNWIQSVGQEDPLEREWQSTPVFFLENSIDREAWRATVNGVAESDTTEQLTLTYFHLLTYW